MINLSSGSFFSSSEPLPLKKKEKLGSPVRNEIMLSTSDISGEQQIGYIISWWIGKLLGRAGFEPA
ncbi:hypothetical protein Lal_00032124 [Lupinus albus]|nr:hypothetical protein Lal_00032124 [Lupinus albus]